MVISMRGLLKIVESQIVAQKPIASPHIDAKTAWLKCRCRCGYVSAHVGADTGADEGQEQAEAAAGAGAGARTEGNVSMCV